MNSKKTLGTVLILATSVGALVGCNAKTAEAPRKPVAAPQELTTPSRAALVFDDNTMFLWREGATQAQVETVLKTAWDLDSRKDRGAALRDKLAAVSARWSEAGFTPEEAKGKIREAQDQLPTYRQSLEFKQNNLDKAQKKVDDSLKSYNDAVAARDAADQTLKKAEDELAACVADAPCNADGTRVGNLTAVRDTAKTESDTKKADAVKKKSDYDKAEKKQRPEIAKWTTKVAEAKVAVSEQEGVITTYTDRMAARGLTFEEFDALEAEGKQVLDADSLNLAIRTICENTDMFQMPPTEVKVVRGEDGRWSASIRNWNPTLFRTSCVESDTSVKVGEGTGSSSKNFSTEDGSIGAVKYTDRGGIFEFDVTTEAGLYSFKIAESRYNAPDRGIYYNGDVLLKDASGKVVRRGSAKFIQKYKAPDKG